MATTRKLFLIGPGFIGGEIINLLLQEGGYEVTTMVRRQEAAPPLEKSGINVILATLDDKNIITQQALKSDVIIHTATADHLPSVEAVLQGIEERTHLGQRTIYIHTSGASLLADDSAGEYKGDKVYHDDKPEEIDALPDSAPHRSIDLAIVRAREQLRDKAKLAIMIPPLIYGVSHDSRLSIQLPTMTRYSLKHGYAGHVGRGLSVWSQVHVADLARAYVLLLHWLESSDSDEIYENPYFFCENGQELSWGECAAELGRALHKIGKFESAQTNTISPKLYSDVFGQDYTTIVLGSNSRNRANRLRKLGWQPREKETLPSLIDDELPLILKDTGAFAGYSKAVAS
jgi:nucleoside-diphosphate-sugar epimerase